MTAAPVPVTVALAPYHHTYEITAGIVALAGMAPTFAPPSTDHADIIDLPLLDYVAARAGGDRGLTAVPVFPARAFVHSWIHVGSAGGVPEPSATAAIYARAILAKGDDPAPEAITVAPPRAVAGASGLRPLFARPGEVERIAFARTGVYPILSVIAIRTELIERERWLASNVYRAFEVARRRYFGRLQDIRGSRAPIPSVAGHAAAVAAVLGPELAPSGLAFNRATLELFLGQAAREGAIARAPDDVAELFADVEPFVDFTDGL